MTEKPPIIVAFELVDEFVGGLSVDGVTVRGWALDLEDEIRHLDVRQGSVSARERRASDAQERCTCGSWDEEDDQCRCPSYYAKEEAALAELCPVHGLAAQEDDR